MLIDEYLPDHDFRFRHAIEIDAPVEHVYPIVRSFDLTEARVLRLLFWIRSIPAKLSGAELLGPTFADLRRAGVVLLDEAPPREVLLGFAGKLWSPFPTLRVLSPAEFLRFAEPGLAKAVWGFVLDSLPDGRTLLTTETRARCLDDASRRLLGRYLVVVRPLSGLTRKSALRACKRRAERASKPRVPGRPA